jgi:uncharacterized membrane protein
MAAESGGMRRRAYLDHLRGIAVLLMIVAHLFDSWTRFPDRESKLFSVVMLFGGMGTTLFLTLAGVAVALSAGSKFRRMGDASAAAVAVVRRGLQIFGLAFVFRVQAWFLGWSHVATDLLKVDILNIMGPSIVIAALLWRAGRTAAGRVTILAAATAVVAFTTPAVRALPPGTLPDAIQGYIVPVPGLSNFVFFPSMALVFAGAAMGVLLDAAFTPEEEIRVNKWLAAGGIGLLVLAVLASYGPSPFPNSEFWSTSPSYLFIRASIVAIGIAASFAWMRMWGAGWSPLVQLGRTSLFIYWIHVEMVYGLISLPLHGSLSFTAACVAYAAFCAFMLVCSLAKEAAVDRFRAHRGARVAVSAAPGRTR